MATSHTRFKTAFGALALFGSLTAQAVEPDSTWEEVLAEAKGQTVYFNAWGGSERINSYLVWVGQQVKANYGVSLEHVKVGDIAEIVGQRIIDLGFFCRLTP